VKDSLKIEIVEDIKVEPAFKSLFFNGGQNSFKLTVKDGSGDYTVSLNSSIASFKQSGQEVTIIP
jgi:hypothetical protein